MRSLFLTQMLGEHLGTLLWIQAALIALTFFVGLAVVLKRRKAWQEQCSGARFAEEAAAAQIAAPVQHELHYLKEKTQESDEKQNTDSNKNESAPEQEILIEAEKKAEQQKLQEIVEQEKKLVAEESKHQEEADPLLAEFERILKTGGSRENS